MAFSGAPLPGGPVGGRQPARSFAHLLEGAAKLAVGLDPATSAAASRLWSSQNIEPATRAAENIVLQTKAPAVPASALAPTDVRVYLDQLRSAANTVAISEATASTKSYLQAQHDALLASEWEASKAQLLTHLGLAPPLAVPRATDTWDQLQAMDAAGAVVAPLGAAGGNGALMGDASSLPFGYGVGDLRASAIVDPVVHGLSRVTAELATRSFTRAAPFPAISKFSVPLEAIDGAAESVGSDAAECKHAWVLLHNITQEKRDAGFGYQAFEQLAGTSLPEVAPMPDVLPDFGMTEGMQLQWCAGALSFLHTAFKHSIEREKDAYEEHPRSSRWVGVSARAARGITGPIALVSAYLNTVVQRYRDTVAAERAQRDAATIVLAAQEDTAPAWYTLAMQSGMVAQGLPALPLIYFLLRCGALSEALQVAQEAAGNVRRALGGAGVTRDTLLLDALCTLIPAFSQLFAAVSKDTGCVLEAIPAAASMASTANTEFVASQLAARREVVAAMDTLGKIFLDESALGFASDVAGADAAVPGTYADPWLVEVACLLSGGAGGSASHHDQQVSPNVFDYLWHRIWFCTTALLSAEVATRSANARAAPDVAQSAHYSLTDLSADVLSLGADHFDADRKHAYSYFETLMLVGEPEMALTHLACHGHMSAQHRYLLDVTHYALALNYYGLLRVLPTAAQLRSFDEKLKVVTPSAEVDCLPVDGFNGLLHELRVVAGDEEHAVYCFDLKLLLTTYVRIVLNHDTVATCSYLSCLPQPELRIPQLAEVLATRAAFATLLGPVELTADGVIASVEKGFLSNYGGDVAVTPLPELQHIILYAADLCYSRGQHHNALVLYLRVASQDDGLCAAMSVLCEMLLPLMSLPLADGADVLSLQQRTRLRELGATLFSMMPSDSRSLEQRVTVPSQQHPVSLDTTRSSVGFLLSLCQFYDLMKAENYRDAMKELEGAGLVTVDGQTPNWQAVFHNKLDVFHHFFADVLVDALQAITAFAQSLQHSAMGRASDSVPQLRLLQRQAHALRAGHTTQMKEYVTTQATAALQRGADRIATTA